MNGIGGYVMPNLAFENVSMRYHTPEGETFALEDFSHVFEQGTFTAVIGPSGCGKSTLLSLAAGLLKPDSGRVLFDGREISGTTPDIGYMLQKDHLFSWLTIEKNAQVGLKVKKMLNEETRARVRELLSSCGLTEFAGSYPHQLSGGMRQRAALVRTLALDPSVLLLDEPFSALDYQTRLAVAQDVYRIIKQTHKTSILVTHDIIEAVSMADRIIVLTKRPGRIKAIHDIHLAGTPIQRRSGGEINEYFDIIWKELDVHV